MTRVYNHQTVPRERFFVYILASLSRVVYTGATRNLKRRVYEHRQGLVLGFTKRYKVTRLVFFEETSSARVVFARERQLKSWSRAKKIQLIERGNPGWTDLAANWFLLR